MESSKTEVVPDNNWYINGIKNRSDDAIRKIYADYFPIIKQFILKNSGIPDDAKDIFTDAMVALFRVTQEKDLHLTCKFSTYLFEICKRLWLKKLRKKKLESTVTITDLEVLTLVQELDVHLEKTERYKLLREKFNLLSLDCKKILELSWHTQKSMQEIAETMDWSYAYARKRKHVCQEKLTEMIKKDPRYSELGGRES